MFSTIPSTGTSTFSNIFKALRASSVAMSCGVVTMTAPATGIFCDSVSWISPVPGGRSISRKSRSPHSVSLNSWVSADVAIGPRQIIGESCSIRNPMDMASTPNARNGSMLLLSGLSGRPLKPSMAGTLGP
ncbi:hypothetical protein D3C81_1744210 [compost metagenome]